MIEDLKLDGHKATSLANKAFAYHCGFSYLYQYSGDSSRPPSIRPMSMGGPLPLRLTQHSDIKFENIPDK
jgi:hypothetical protein